MGNIIAVACPSHDLVFQRAFLFFQGHQISHYLTWMALIRQPVDHRNGRMAGEIFQLRLLGRGAS